MASPYIVLGGILYRIVGPPWRLERSTGAGGGWAPVGERPSSPVLRPGGLQHAVEIVVLAGDPPDPVMLGGDYIYVRRMQPDFTLSPDGDLTIMEGA